MKFIPTQDAANFLFNTGLLFEINRQVLHPLGLALEIQMEEDGSQIRFGRVWDNREDPEGILFGYEPLMEGARKFHSYMKRQGVYALLTREQSVGYIHQQLPKKYKVEVPGKD